MQQRLRYIKIPGKSEQCVRIVFLGAGQKATSLRRLFHAMPPYTVYLLEIQDLPPSLLIAELKELVGAKTIEIIGLSMGARAAIWAALHLSPRSLVLIAPEGAPPHPWLRRMLHPHMNYLWHMWYMLLPVIRKVRRTIVRLLGTGIPCTKEEVEQLRKHWAISAHFALPADICAKLYPVPVSIYLPRKDRIISPKSVQRFWQSYKPKELFFIEGKHLSGIKKQCYNIVYKE
jgi:esterase/lipase